MISTITSVLSNLKKKMEGSGEKIKLNSFYKEEVKGIIQGLEVYKTNKKVNDLIQVLETTIKCKSGSLAKKHRDAILKLLVELETLTEENLTEDQEQQISDLIQEIQEEFLETELDMECGRYNKYTQKNPAPYINLDGNQYRLRLSGQNIQRSSDLNQLTEKLKTEILPAKFGHFLNEIGGAKQIMYNHQKIIIYKHPETNEPLYDLNHTIRLCTNSETTNAEMEYKRNKNRIKCRSCKDNEFGGFYVKEFISQQDFYEMILHSTTQFSQRFKSELSILLDKWTRDGIFAIDNNQIISAPVIPEDPFLESPDKYHYTQTYHNYELVDFVKGLIKRQQKDCWRKYHKKHVMYLILILCRDPLDKNRIIVKIGYSHDFIQRLNQLRSENENCNVYVLGLKYVNSQTDEKEFHKLLHLKFPLLRVHVEARQEYYVFDKDLWKEFSVFDDSTCTPSQDRLEEMDSETESVLEEYFGNLEERMEFGLIQKTVIQIELIQNEHQRIFAEKSMEIYKYLMEKREERLAMKYFAEMPREIRSEMMRKKEIEFLNQIDPESRILWLRRNNS